MVLTGSSASVTDTERHQCNIAYILLLILPICFFKSVRCGVGIVIALGRHMYKHLAVIQSVPDKGVIRKSVDIVPAELDCHKTIHTALFNDLRQSCRVAENIGQPKRFYILLKLLFKKILPVEALTDKAFAARKIGVRFNPHTALWLNISSFNSLLYFFEKLR